MLSYQQRVVHEKHELDAKLAALKGFIASPAFEPLSLLDRKWLTEQQAIMEKYSEVLASRINRFSTQQ